MALVSGASGRRAAGPARAPRKMGGLPGDGERPVAIKDCASEPMSTIVDDYPHVCGAELHRGFLHRDIKPSNMECLRLSGPDGFGVKEHVGTDCRDGFRSARAPPEQIAGTARIHPTVTWALRDAVDAADGSPALRGARR